MAGEKVDGRVRGKLHPADKGVCRSGRNPCDVQIVQVPMDAKTDVETEIGAAISPFAAAAAIVIGEDRSRSWPEDRDTTCRTNRK